MVSIRFEDPPERSRGEDWVDPSELTKNRDRDRIVEALRSYPGRWAVVSTHRSRPAASRTATLLRARFPDIEFRASGGVAGAKVYGRSPSHDPPP